MFKRCLPKCVELSFLLSPGSVISSSRRSVSGPRKPSLSGVRTGNADWSTAEAAAASEAEVFRLEGDLRDLADLWW